MARPNDLRRNLNDALDWGRMFIYTNDLNEAQTLDINSVFAVCDNTQLEPIAVPRSISISGIVQSAIEAGLIIPPSSGEIAVTIAPGSGVYVLQDDQDFVIGVQYGEIYDEVIENNFIGQGTVAVTYAGNQVFVSGAVVDELPTVLAGSGAYVESSGTSVIVGVDYLNIQGEVISGQILGQGSIAVGYTADQVIISGEVDGTGDTVDAGSGIYISLDGTTKDINVDYEVVYSETVSGRFQGEGNVQVSYLDSLVVISGVINDTGNTVVAGSGAYTEVSGTSTLVGVDYLDVYGQTVSGQILGQGSIEVGYVGQNVLISGSVDGTGDFVVSGSGIDVETSGTFKVLNAEFGDIYRESVESRITVEGDLVLVSGGNSLTISGTAGGSAGVASFNGRTGTVTLLESDLNNLLGSGVQNVVIQETTTAGLTVTETASDTSIVVAAFPQLTTISTPGDTNFNLSINNQNYIEYQNGSGVNTGIRLQSFTKTDSGTDPEFPFIFGEGIAILAGSGTDQGGNISIIAGECTTSSGNEGFTFAGDVTIQGGFGGGSGNAGGVFINGGDSDREAAGDVFINAGDCFSTAINDLPGDVSIRAGKTVQSLTGTAVCGEVRIQGGLADNGNVKGGAVKIDGGFGRGNADGGNVEIAGGTSFAAPGSGGDVRIDGGLALTNTNAPGGRVFIEGGASDDVGQAGFVRVAGGSATDGGTPGPVMIVGGETTDPGQFGGQVSISGGSASTNATAARTGNVFIRGGAGEFTAQGGILYLIGGQASGQAAGPVILEGGDCLSPDGTGDAGDVLIRAGSRANSIGGVVRNGDTFLRGGQRLNEGDNTQGGEVTVAGGIGGTGQEGGAVLIVGGGCDSVGSSNIASGGLVEIQGGFHIGNGAGFAGDVLIAGGDALGPADGGNVQIRAGESSVSGVPGNVSISGGFTGTDERGEVYIYQIETLDFHSRFNSAPGLRLYEELIVIPGNGQALIEIGPNTQYSAATVDLAVIDTLNEYTLVGKYQFASSPSKQEDNAEEVNFVRSDNGGSSALSPFSSGGVSTYSVGFDNSNAEPISGIAYITAFGIR